MKGLIAAATLAVAALALPGAARAGCGKENPNCIVSTAPLGTSDNRAASTAFVNQAITHGAGGANGQIQYNNGGAFGGFTASGDATINTSTGAVTIQPNAVTSAKIAANAATNAKIQAGAANTIKGSLDGATTSDLAIASCSAIYQFTQWVSGSGWQCGLTPVLPSRAVAATLNLSAFSSVVTLGYAQPGDGGGAQFTKLSSGNFVDSFIPTGTGGGSITNAGTTCTNGTYLGVSLTGGHGTNVQATIVVSGTVVTSVTVTGTGGNAYQVNDVLAVAASTLGTCTGFAWTVGSVTTPTGSFTDSGSNKWQIIADSTGRNNIKQFGAACNWTKTGGDAGATNDTMTVQNALNYGSAILSPTVDAGGLAGRPIVIPNCYTLLSAHQVPFGVTFEGVGRYSSGVKIADSLSASSHFMTLCDPTTHLACFGTRVQDMMIFPGSGAANNNIAAIYSNSVQQQNAVSRVLIFPGPRVCIYWDTGFGGAALVGTYDTDCNPFNTSANAGIIPGYTAAVQSFRDMVVETNGLTGNGFLIASTAGGVINIDGLHTEGISTPIFYNVTSAAPLIHIENATGGNTCVSFVVRQGGSVANRIKFGSFLANGCTNAYNNAGTLVTGDLNADVTF
ncbi:hypothetical protein ACRQ5Q_22235 [Bradyrhizobium sp. PMVTL-01]|uniref:hypothetical protein n=1 Tax=Bradyrhizobium sp. PMVTL-01 TaxID=3434999 RepID=UPI003F723A02